MTDASLEQMLKHGMDRLIFMFLPIMILFLIEYINCFQLKNNNLDK